MLLVQKLHYVSKVVTYSRRASPTGPTVQIWLSLIRASGQNSEDPSLSPGWISMFPATEKKKQKKQKHKNTHTKKNCRMKISLHSDLYLPPKAPSL